MTLAHFIVTGAAVVVFGAGYYSHYRWGSRLAADANKIKSAL